LINFFFQAEDGIRDFHVTGVQTCALPIFKEALRYRCTFIKRGSRYSKPWKRKAWSPTGESRASFVWHRCPSITAMKTFTKPFARSEERRVGKERSCWWSRWPKREKWRADS